MAEGLQKERAATVHVTEASNTAQEAAAVVYTRPMKV